MNCPDKSNPDLCPKCGWEHQGLETCPIKTLQNFSKTITKLRKKRGLSLPGLAQKAGIGKSLLFKIETSPKANPTLKTLAKISSALGVDVSSLVSYK